MVSLLIQDKCKILPTGFCDSGNFPLKRQLPETDAADAELPHVSPRATATKTSVVRADLELRLSFLLDYQTLLGHGNGSSLFELSNYISFTVSP